MAMIGDLDGSEMNIPQVKAGWGGKEAGGRGGANVIEAIESNMGRAEKSKAASYWDAKV